MLRWGIVSTAKIGIEQVIPGILLADNGIVTAIASRDESRAKAVAERFNIQHTFGDYDALLASDLVDAVYIPLPTSQHAEWAAKAARAGKHVLCEKPIALKADQIDDIIAAHEESGKVVSEAFMVTYHPQWHKVRSLIADGAIGQLRLVQSAFCYHNVDPNNMRNVPALGGGVLPDIGVYPTVTTRFSTGAEPVRVSAAVDWDETFGTDTFASFRADFGSFELSAYIATQMALRQEISFHGDKGWISVQAPFNAGLYDSDAVFLNNANHSEIQEFRFPGVHQYQKQVEAFGHAVQSGDTSGIFSLEDSKKNQLLIDAIYRAGKSGEWEAV